MSTPGISIITPSYNQGHFIEETICSVLDQGYPNLEYMIIDGGSKDNTVEIIKKYERHLTYWVSEKDKGQSDAINKGFRKATGDVINWLNSDDYYEPGTLHKVGNAFADPAVNVFCGTSRIFGNCPDRNSNGTDIYTGNLAKTIGWARIDQPETFFRKSCLDEIGYVDEQFHYIMDKELWIRYLLRYGLDNIVKTEDRLVHFRIHGDSKTNNFQEKFHRETINMFGSHFPAALAANPKLAGILQMKTLSLAYPSAAANVVQEQKVFNYFLLQEFLASYAQNNYGYAKSLRPFINKQMLQPEDAAEFQKVSVRLTFAPRFLKQAWNSLKKS